MPLISAVVPVYNVQNFLPECLDSALAQTLKDIEIICVDDGSTDQSPVILDEYTKKDPRVRVIHQKNGGYGKAMNTGLAVATGKYIAVLESDDFILPDAYETLFANAEKYDADVVRANYYRLTTKNGQSYLQSQQLTKDYSWYYRLICPNDELETYLFVMHNWTGIHRRSYLMEKDIRFNETPGASFQDNGFFFQVYAQTDRLLYIPNHCYCYRFDNPGSSIHSKEKVYAAAEEYRFIQGFLDSHSDFRAKVMPAYYARMFRIYHETYMRIAKVYRKEFSDFFREEMLKARASQYMQPDLLYPNEQILLQQLLQSSKLYRFTANHAKGKFSPVNLALRAANVYGREGLPGLKNRYLYG